MLRPVAITVAENETEAGRAEDDRKQDEPELQAAEPKEQVRTLLMRARHSPGERRRNADASRASRRPQQKAVYRQPGSGKRTCMWSSWFGYGTTTPLGPRSPVE